MTKQERNIRIPLQVLIEYKAADRAIVDFSSNLSQGGIFIETSSLMPIGSDISVTFMLPHSKEELALKGKVVWTRDANESKRDQRPGMGVKFDGNDARTMARLRSAIEYFEKYLDQSA